jgi:uncharacterized protein YbjT (DUF2867 family)
MSPFVLIVGAAAPVGPALLEALLRRNVPVRVLSSTSGTRDRFPVRPLLEQMAVPPGPAPRLDAALADITHVVLLAPPAADAVVQHGLVIEAAARTRRPVHLVAVLPMGAVVHGGPFQLARWHAVTTAQARSADLPLTELYPQLLMHTLLRLAASIQSDNLLFGAFGSARLPHVDARDVAAAAAAVVTSPGHDGRAYVLTGPQALSYDEVAAVLSDVQGRPIRYVDLAPEAYHEHLVGSGLTPWMADDLAALARRVRPRAAWPVSVAVADLTGRPARPLRRFLAEHADAFRARPDAAATLTPYAFPL